MPYISMPSVPRLQPVHGSHPDFLCKRSLPNVAATQHLADVPGSENGEKAGDPRTVLELGPFVFIEPRHFIDRHLRFPGEELDRSPLMGFLAGLRVHASIRVLGKATPPVPGVPYASAHSARLTARRCAVCKRTERFGSTEDNRDGGEHGSAVERMSR